VNLSSIPEDPQDNRRPLVAALTFSILVHMLGFLFFIATQKFTLAALPRPHPTQTPDFVTLSQAIRIEKKAVPVPVPRPQRQQPPPAQPVRPAEPHRVAVQPQPQPTVVMPTLPPPVETAKPEVSKPGPKAKPTVAPTPVRVAAAPPARPDSLNSQRIAQLEQTFSKTISQARSQANPLRVNPATPAAPKQYKMQFEGHFGPLHNGQGEYWPAQSWREANANCYYMQYDFVYEDGRFERGSVPWPVCFSERSDPFESGDVARARRTPLPPPPPGWTLQNVASLGKALRPYFPNTQFPTE
jgi:outer membrane biosynthesis protein TonB